METKDDNKTRSFIRERIVPKKKTKRILFTVLGVIVLAALFGVIAGVSFSVSRDLFGREEAPTDSQVIVLHRGDREELPEGEDLLTPTRESETEMPESSENPSDPAGSETEPVGETEKEPVTLNGMFRAVEDGIAPVALVKPAAPDLFNEPGTRRIETFGTFIAESETAVFLLTDGREYSKGSFYHVTVGRDVFVMEPQGVDEFTGLAVLKIGKDHLSKTVRILPLGNSSYLNRGNRVFLIGSLYGRYVATDEGWITFISQQESITDSYQQLLYTNMTRKQGSAGILLNEEGEVTGWMSDDSAGEGDQAIVSGINPLKFLLNQLCSGEPSPYLGIVCRAVGNDEVLGTERKAGLYVQSVLPDSPAYFAGLQAGDRIIAMNGRAMVTNRGLQQFLETVRPEEPVEIRVGRMNGEVEESMDLSAVIGER